MAPIPLEIKMEKEDADPDPSNESEGTFERTAQQASVGQSQLQVKLTRLPASVLQQYNKDATGNTCLDGDTDLRTVLGLHTELDIKFEPGEDLKEEPLDPMDHDGAVDNNGDLLPTSEHILVTNVKHINDHEDYSRPTKKQRKEKSKKTNTKNQNNLGLQSKKIYTTRARMKNEKENETKKIIDSKKGAPAKSDVSAKTANNADGLLPPSQTISETTEKQMHDREDYSKLSKKKAKGINKKTNTKNKEGLQSQTLNTTRARKKNENRINIDSENNVVSEKENSKHADGLLPPSQTISETTEKQMHDRENYSQLSKKKAKGINKKTNTKNKEGLQSETLNTTRARKKNENRINIDSENNVVSEKENSKHADGLLPANKYISNPNISSETHQVVKPICFDEDLSRSSKNRTESEKTVLEDQNKEVIVNNTEKVAITYSNSGSANNFSCVKCNFSTEREYTLNNHIQAHLASKTYNCDMCSYISVNKYVFIRHIKRHADEKAYVCKVCNKKIVALSSLNRHFKTHQTENLLSNKNANVSNEQTNTMYKTKVVYNQITRSKKLFDDNVCVSNKTLDKSRKIFPLSSSELLIPTKYSCTECKFTTNAANLLKSHIEAHSATKKYICDLCSYITKDKQQLHRHFRYHNGEKTKIHNCEICDKKFSVRHKLTEHVRTHTGEKPYACKLCDIKYGHSYSLTLHMKTHTGEDKKYTCKICDKKFTSTSAFNKHVRIHTGDKPYSCKLCSKKFIRNDTLNSHIRLIHKGEKPYGCEICSKKFKLHQSLRTHMRTHTGEKPYSCKFCDKKFRNSSSLYTHQMLHTGEKPHACKSCDRKFITSSGLANHIRTHTGEKPHDCKICGRKFARTITLKNHMVIHTGRKPFACNICDKAYRRKATLKAHMGTHSLGNLVL